jgi:hypothetical protein
MAEEKPSCPVPSDEEKIAMVVLSTVGRTE